MDVQNVFDLFKDSTSILSGMGNLFPLSWTGSEGSNDAISLMFQNDGNWTTHAEKPSALYFHNEASYEEANSVCSSYNETLVDCESLSALASQVSYQKFLGLFDDSSKIWVANNQLASLAPNSKIASCESPDPSSQAKSSFLCTNSAPFTSKVGTDFSDYPRVEVVSKGATFVGTRDHMSFRFTGVPYAKAPLGDLRFVHAQEWGGKGRIDATSIRPACLQLNPFSSTDLNPWGFSEDCLYINIFTPHLPSSSPKVVKNLKPVMVWYHGGGNAVGTGNDMTFDGGSLVSRSDVVVVSVNYRLNVFGNLGLDNETIPGNFALSDRIMALQWIKKHIVAFGGDPDRVTIFGQSAGGWAIGELITSPRAEGLFVNAIAQSGINIVDTTYGLIHAIVDPVLAPLCDGTVTPKCLLSLPAETLLNATATVPQWSSVVDGNFRVGSAMDRVALGPDGVNKVNLITGYTPEEGQTVIHAMAPGDISPDVKDLKDGIPAMLGPEFAQMIIESGLWKTSKDFTAYNASQNVVGDLFITCPSEAFIDAAAKSSAFPSMYVYSMERGYGMANFNPHGLCTFPVGNPQPYYRCHGGDLYEVFGTYYIFDQPTREDADVFNTNLVQDMWGSFARTGDPNVDKDYLQARGYESTLEILEKTQWKWERYIGDKENVAKLDWTDLAMTEGLLDRERCKLLLRGGSS